MSARLFAQIAGIDTTDPEQRTVLWRALGHAERTGFHVCRTCAVEIQNAACGYTDPAASHELSVEVQKLVPSLWGSISELARTLVPNGDRLSYEYRRSDSSGWLRAKGRTVAISDLRRGEFHATFRARDGRGLYSEPITRTWSVADNPWNEWRAVGNGNAPAQALRGSSREFGCLALSPDGWNVAVGHGSAGVICRVSDGGFFRRLPEQPTLITNFAFSPDGFLLASRDYNNTVRLWDAFTGELLQTFVNNDGRITALAINHDGKIVATGGADGTIRLRRVADGRSIQTLTAATSPVTSLVFSPNLSTLATANQDGTIRLWNILDGSLLRTWSAHRAEVNCLAFDASGQSLTSGGTDGKAMLWKIPEGTQIRDMVGHTGRVNCVAFHPDGTTLATGGSDRALRL